MLHSVSENVYFHSVSNGNLTPARPKDQRGIDKIVMRLLLLAPLISVYDILGRIVHKQNVENPSIGDNAITFEPSGLPKGVYLFRLQNNNTVRSGRLVFLGN